MGVSFTTRVFQAVVAALAMLAFVLLLISYFTPFAFSKYTPGEPGCYITELTYFSKKEFVCGDGCVLTACPNDQADWKSGDCAPDPPSPAPTYCRQTYIYQVVQYSLIGSMVFIGIGLILFAISVFGKIRATSAISLLVVALLGCFICVFTFAIGLPLATAEDYYDHTDDDGGSKATECPPVDGPNAVNNPNQYSVGQYWPFCSQLILNNAAGTYETTWGPEAGWILSLLALVSLLVSVILMGVFANPKLGK
eukprot:TRINITY_DN9551_c0_g1_i1.p1 TRINITY_DN9551_c0_g1~~TRINITY_DN9551_c0_g1_i1.p1  ORF type:complete len:260 (-),score=43.74 TRINITY_DN9551_c0_g1_i1:58-813(-)